jgi:hypothetical protein
MRIVIFSDVHGNAVARDYTAVGFPNAQQAAQQLLKARGFSVVPSSSAKTKHR